MLFIERGESRHLVLTLKRFCRAVEGGHGPLHPQLRILTADIRAGWLASDEYYGVRFHSFLSSLFSHLRMKKRNGISFKLGCHVQTYPTRFIFDFYLLHC